LLSPYEKKNWVKKKFRPEVKLWTRKLPRLADNFKILDGTSDSLRWIVQDYHQKPSWYHSENWQMASKKIFFLLTIFKKILKWRLWKVVGSLLLDAHGTIHLMDFLYDEINSLEKYFFLVLTGEA
jgi:hypothetical protein